MTSIGNSDIIYEGGAGMGVLFWEIFIQILNTVFLVAVLVVVGILVVRLLKKTK